MTWCRFLPFFLCHITNLLFVNRILWIKFEFFLFRLRGCKTIRSAISAALLFPPIEWSYNAYDGLFNINLSAQCFQQHRVGMLFALQRLKVVRWLLLVFLLFRFASFRLQLTMKPDIIRAHAMQADIISFCSNQLN